MKKVITRVIIGLIVLIILIISLSSFIINIQWFKEVGYLGVFFTSFKAKIIIFIPLFIVFFLIVNFYVQYVKNKYLVINNIIYDKKILRIQRRIINLASIILSFIISIMFTGSFWYKILEFYNATSFNQKDPIFHLDVSFYVFKLPLIEEVLGVLITIVIVLIVVTLSAYALSITKEGLGNPRGFVKIKDTPMISFVTKQLAIFGAILLILLSGAFYLKGFNLVYSSRGVAFGASYTDVHVALPMYRIISVFCIISGFVVAFSIIKGKFKLIIGTAVFMVLLIMSEGIISAAVEKFVVSPNTWDKEKTYLGYNIQATRQAFGLNNIQVKNFPADNNLTQADINNNKGTVDNIRINEFSQALDVYNQIQAIRNYYTFNDVDIDRYIINGQLRQVLVAARELDNSTRDTKFQTWQNKHLFYTHGYGVVMSYTNTVTTAGLPDFILQDIPTTGQGIKLDKPQIYFGESNEDYAIVGAQNNEIDYPTSNGNQETRYSGTAGIPLTPINRLLFSINKGTTNILLSSDITSQSKILINRNIMDRVKKIAPFINYDSDPYVVVANGKIYWIIDGYTTTDKYPYSEPYGGINYIRNSIKVVVDAYNGSVNFYLTDKTDALAQTMGKIYKGLFKDMSQMPADLRNHLRYSEDVFLTQAKVYEKYHMEDPSVFYNSEDLWSIAKQKDSNGGETDVNAVYQVMKLPGQSNEEFLLTIPYTVAKKQNMEAWLAVQMNPNNLGKMILEEFPKDKAVYGPEQFESQINTDTDISSQLTLWNQQGSQVVLGETNIIPIKNSLIYVKPMYLKAQSGTSLPELKKVIVGFDNNIVMADNIQQAFLSLFNTNIGEGSAPTPGQTTVQPQNDNIKNLVNQAADLFNKAQEAQKSGDWAAYGNYLNQLQNTLNTLQESTNK